MLFDQMTKEMMIEENEFSQMENTDEIVKIIKKKTLDSLEEETSFMEEFPNPIYAVMRLEYLAESQNEMNYQMLLELYKEKKLVSHLMEVQKRAIQFMREEKPQMMRELKYSGRGRSEVPDHDFSIERDGDKGSGRSLAPASNFKIRQEIFPDRLTPSERLNYNLEAIFMLNRVEKGERVLDESAQEVLARYVGWGGLSEVFAEERTGQWSEARKFLKENLSLEEYEAAKESTLTAFFTPKTVIDGVYKTVLDMGFKQGNILEPSMGIGHFIGRIPEQMNQSKFYGVELDRISGRIGRLLYPNSDIQIKGFEETCFSNNFFDLVIGNVPFGDFTVNDRAYNQNNFLIHDYFFAKSIDKVRNGGVIAFITSSGTMDKKDESIRKYINTRAEFLGAIRLPNDTFNVETVALPVRKR